MDRHKRETLKRGVMVLTGLGAMSLIPGLGLAAEATMTGDSYDAMDGDILIHPVQHASFVMQGGGKTIYSDPVGGASLYADLPRPDLILITHEHRDHFDAETLNGLASPETDLVANPAVFGMLPDGLKARATSIANGESTQWQGIGIDAVPAYNMTEDRLKYHPRGRDNGYVLGLSGRKIYIAGDTENIPELAERTGIDVAFLPMNLPYTMSVDQAAEAVAMFVPRFVYPYHYRGSDLDRFEELVAGKGIATEVVRHDWYTGA